MREVGFTLVIMAMAGMAFSQGPKPVLNQVDPGSSQLSPAVQSAIDRMREKLAPNLLGGMQEPMQALASPTYPLMAKNLMAKGRDLAQPAPKSEPCSVPLLQAQIRQDVQFALKTLPPANLEPMPHAAVPAPACDPAPGQ